MNAVHGADSTEALNLRLVTAWTAVCVLLFIIVPMAAPVLLPLCVAPPLAWYWAAGRRLPLRQPSAVVLALALAAIYLLINASWSLSPATAYRTVAYFLGIAIGGYVLLDALAETDNAVLHAMAAGFLMAMAIGSVIVCIEAFSGQALRRLLLSYLPVLQGGWRHLRVDGGWVVEAQPHLLNRSTTALTLLFWPAVLIVDRLGLVRRQRLLLLMALAVAAAAVARSQHGTSKVAFVGAAATFMLLLGLPMLGRWLVRAGWVAATVLAVPVAIVLYSAQAYQVAWLPPSAQHRIVIWGYTADQVTKAPLLGTGVSSARVVSQQGPKDRPTAPGSAFQLSTNLHSHNAYLQIWYETGAVGAFILLGLGLLVLRALATAPLAAQASLHATFVASVLLAASSFSIWAPWFMASLAIGSAYASLGAALVSRGAAPTD